MKTLEECKNEISRKEQDCEWGAIEVMLRCQYICHDTYVEYFTKAAKAYASQSLPVSQPSSEADKVKRLIDSIQKILDVKSTQVLDEGAFKHINLFAHRAMSIAKSLQS